MSDYTEIYSLLFTSIIILFLFIIINNIVSDWFEKNNNILNSNLILSKSLNYSKVIMISELNQAYVVNLDSGEIFGELNNSISPGLPCLILNEVMSVGRVSVN